MANIRRTRRIIVALRMAGVAGQEKLSGIFRYLGDNHDWDITLLRTAADFTTDRIRAALQEKTDGFIVSIPDTERTAALLAHETVPTVIMDIHDAQLAKRTKNITFIRNSPKEIGFAAADFLLSTGRCRSYAFIHNPAVVEWSVDRCLAFRQTLADHGLWSHEISSLEALSTLERPIGILAANDDCAYNTLEFCRAHRLRVPEDVLVLGVNNDTLICENCRPRLSSIQPDFEQEGFLAAEELARMFAAESRGTNAKTIFVGVRQIVHRESTAEISQAGKLVQKALAYMQKQALKGISAADVISHLGCSRRLADLRFHELQGISIGESLINLRLAAVQRLLLSTREPIESIATSCGFRNANYLRNLFKRRFGMTMRNWRECHATPTSVPQLSDETKR